MQQNWVKMVFQKTKEGPKKNGEKQVFLEISAKRLKLKSVVPQISTYLKYIKLNVSKQSKLIYVLTITINLNLVAVVHEFWAFFKRRDITNRMKLCDIALRQRMQHKGKLQGRSPSSCKKLKIRQSKMNKTSIFEVLRKSNHFRNLITFCVNKSFDKKLSRQFLN